MLGLVSAFGYRSVAAVIGHDQGSPLAGWCAVVRPDVFRSVVMMSAPFGGPPALPFNTADAPRTSTAGNTAADRIYDELAALKPPRKHYQRYYSTREANDNMWHAPQGIHAFLRAYYHMKSADWKQNKPSPLAARTAAEWAKLPRYYVMDLNKGMAETVAAEMPSAAEIAACKWLPDEELKVYSTEYGRTGFQGGLEGYRVGSTASTPRSCRCFPAARSTCRRCSSAGRATGASIRIPARWSDCRRRLHADARHPSRRRRRALGAAGAAGGGEQAAGPVSSNRSTRMIAPHVPADASR